MSLFKKHLVVTAFSIINLLFCSVLFAANIYVDNTLSANITGGTYSIANRDDNGSNGNAYTTIQTAVNAMNGGDDVYIREGTYFENVDISPTKNGSSNDWSSIQSYTGEWAVIDGRHNQKCTIGYANTGSLGANDIKYWKVERLEITGGTKTDGGGGFCGNGGPFIIKYNYFHDNICASNGENPAALKGYTWKDSIIEYNWFNNNGSTQNGDNGGDISIFADYRYKDPGVDFNTGSYSGYYRARNEVRYNYFESGVNGIRQKSIQDMTDGDFTLPNKYQTWGENIHHNIFGAYSYSSIQIWGDFTQVHHNITESAISVGSYTSGIGTLISHVSIYNNTLIGANLRHIGGTADTTAHPYITMYNNIIDNFGGHYHHVDINISAHSGAYDDGLNSSDYADTIIDHNYVYRPFISDHYLIGGDNDAVSPIGRLTTKEFNIEYDVTNYTKASTEGSDNLFQGSTGANRFLTRSTHVIEGATNIANGGIGGPHPYLSEITLPSYIGAVNPNNSSWVANLLCLTDISVLKNASIDGPVCSINPKAADPVTGTVIRK